MVGIVDQTLKGPMLVIKTDSELVHPLRTADSRSISIVLALLPMPKASVRSCNAVSQLLTNHTCLLFAFTE